MFNIAKWLPVIFNGMQTVEKIKNAKGTDKLNAVLDDLNDRIDDIEGAVGKDLLKNVEVLSALTNAVTAIKTLENVVKNAKAVVNK